MKILLHICCGVCAAGAADILLAEGHGITGYYFNPNISSQEEYDKRLEASNTVAGVNNFPIITPAYNPKQWMESTSELWKEPEGGKRCEVCFRIRLQSTYDYLKEYDFDAFTTTLTIGPMKSADTINRIGKEIGGDKFLSRDFKKNGGAQRAIQLARQYQIYRQNYCGCVYSLRITNNPKR
jgi:predicted adenine nucleotide alpha hydrolase (AANH) superfamily ATPase